MRISHLAVIPALVSAVATSVAAQEVPAPMLVRPDSMDPAWILTQRLDLERYKATVKGLTQFGDRRQGTDRNAKAVDWIEAQLKSYGCSNTERIVYDYRPAAQAGGGRGAGATAFGSAQGGGRMRGVRARTGVNTDSLAQKDLTLRALNSQPTTPGERQEVFCT